MSGIVQDDLASGTFQGGGLAIADDERGRRLSLVSSGLPPWSLARLIAPLVGLAVVGGWGWFIWTQWKQVKPPLPGQRPDDLMLLGLMGFIGLFLAWGCAGMLGRLFSYWRELSWDAERRQFQARRHGWLIWGHQTITLSFDAVERWWFELGRESGGPLPLELGIRYQQRGSNKYLHIPFTVALVSARPEAQDLVFRAGRVMRAQGYYLEQFGPSRQTLELVTTNKRAREIAEDLDDDEEEGGSPPPPGVMPIPDATVHTDVAAMVAPREELPEPIDDLEPVNLATLEQQTAEAKLTEWRPGEMVRIVRPAAPPFAYMVVAGFGAAVGGGIGYGPLSTVLGIVIPRQSLAVWAVVTWAACAAALALVFLARNGFRRQEIVFDFIRHRITSREGDEEREWPQSDARGLILWSQSVVSKGPNDAEEQTEYRGRLELDLGEETLALLCTAEPRGSSRDAKAVLQPVADGLAASLGVGVGATGGRSVKRGATPIPSWLRITWIQAAILIGVLVIGVVLAGAAMLDGRRALAHVAAISAAGGKITWMTGHSFGDQSVAKDFWQVRLNNPVGADDQLSKLHADLAALPDLELNLEDSDFSDRGLSSLEGLTNLLILELGDTQVTDAGMAKLPDLPRLLYLSMAFTKVGDAGMKRLALAAPNLQFLLLGATQVSDVGLAEIGRLKHLKHVFVTGPRVTPAGFDKLRQALPGAKVEQQGQ